MGAGTSANYLTCTQTVHRHLLRLSLHQTIWLDQQLEDLRQRTVSSLILLTSYPPHAEHGIGAVGIIRDSLAQRLNYLARSPPGKRRWRLIVRVRASLAAGKKVSTASLQSSCSCFALLRDCTVYRVEQPSQEESDTEQSCKGGLKVSTLTSHKRNCVWGPKRPREG